MRQPPLLLVFFFGVVPQFAPAQHWAFSNLGTPDPPAVRDSAWPRNPIDAFVARRLEEKRRTPSPEADRRTLIRRVSFDLTGLPPTPAEVARFVADRSVTAYDALVDRLLASPHYGERWARHWLDVARYGASDGFEHDAPRDHAWRYRAWVVDAFNADMPYDEFARRQIAGDVLVPEDPAAAIATGFLVAGPYDAVGHAQFSAARRAIARQDEIHEIVGTTMQALLGLTLHCARCHDHKSDPITQLDYYRVAASFAGVGRGARNVTPVTARGLELRTRRDRLRKQLAALEEPFRVRIHRGRGTPLPVISWNFEQGAQGAALHGAARLERGALVLDGKSSYASSAPLPFALREKTLEAWVQLDGAQQLGGAAISIQEVGGKVFDAIVYGGADPRRWMAGSNGYLRSESFGGPLESEAARWVHIAIVYAADRTITAYRDGKPYGESYRKGWLMEFGKGKARVLIGLRKDRPAGAPLLRASIRRVAVHDRALSAAEVAHSFAKPVDSIRQEDVVAQMSPEQRIQRTAWNVELGSVTGELDARVETKGFCVVPKEPDQTHIFSSGQPAVTPGGVAAIKTLSSDFRLPPDASDGVRRQRLAVWVTDPRNPLFARVAVNRVWHYHFGRGLVDTPSDFGRSGGRPSHPQLLDWLASEFVRSGYRLKALHRLIVTSAAYRQSRTRGRRLEAEAVRDAILVVSGQLDRTVGGRGYRDFVIRPRGPTFFYEPTVGDADRRSLYRMWVRGGRNSFLDALDCPDPSVTTPKRDATTTPLQALALLNNAFVLRMADRFAERLRQESPGGVPDQIARAYEVAFARLPSRRELERLRSLVRRHGLAVLARSIFNSHEFVYIH